MTRQNPIFENSLLLFKEKEKWRSPMRSHERRKSFAIAEDQTSTHLSVGQIIEIFPVQV
jgi:hypothetical protein